MPEYRAFKVEADSLLTELEIIVCNYESEAIEKAQKLVDGHDIELWTGPRFVTRLRHR